MSTEDMYGSVLPDEQSLIGPPTAPDAQAASGLAEHSPEQEEIRKALLEQKELGLYTDAELLADGRKIVPNKGNPNLAQDVHTGAELVRHASGAWLKPGDADYDQTFALTTAPLDKNQHNPDAAAVLEKKDSSLEVSNTRADNELHEELTQKLNTMVAINGGSSTPNIDIDRMVLARIPASSTAELTKIVGKLSALEGFPLAGQVEEVDPNKIERIKADAVGSSAGEQQRYAIAQERKKKADLEFAQLRAKERRNEG